jgi:hypothetical protein
LLWPFSMPTFRRRSDLIREGLTVPSVPTSAGVALLETWWGELYKADTPGGNLCVKRSNFPFPPYAQVVNVLETGDVSKPALARTWDEKTWLLFVQGVDPDFAVYRIYSDGDGIAGSWSTPEVAFAGGTWIATTTSPLTGARLEIAYVSGQFLGKLHLAGIEESWTCVDDSEDPLTPADSDFDIEWTKTGDNSSQVILTFTVEGEEGTSDWLSPDDGQSFKRVS